MLMAQVSTYEPEGIVGQPPAKISALDDIFVFFNPITRK